MSRKARIEQLLLSLSEVSYQEVIDESHRHNVPDGAETHFKLTVVSEDFVDMTKVARHRRLYSLMAEEQKSGLHALALHLYTAEEWAKLTISPASPDCLGGSQADSR